MGTLQLQIRCREVRVGVANDRTVDPKAITSLTEIFNVDCREHKVEQFVWRIAIKRFESWMSEKIKFVVNVAVKTAMPIKMFWKQRRKNAELGRYRNV